MQIITRAQWGAKPWRDQPSHVPLTERFHFLVHYHGGPPRNSTGVGVPREVEAIHLARRWSGVGYNFLVDQAGTIYEGRGWTLQGAHCPGRNRDGIGVYVAVGGSQEPTDAAKRSVKAIYTAACSKAGRTLKVGVHGDHYPTECAGPRLTPWVHSGMPVTGGGAQDGPPVVLPPLDEQEWRPTGRLTTKQVQELVGVTADGIYGPATTTAVRDLQAALDLTADGLWGPATEGEVMSLQSDIKALSKKVDGTTEWARKAVNAALWGGPARTTERLSAVLASTTGVDEQALAVAIADAIRDDVTSAVKDAAPGATADQIADEIARRLAKTE